MDMELINELTDRVNKLKIEDPNGLIPYTEQEIYQIELILDKYQYFDRELVRLINDTRENEQKSNDSRENRNQALLFLKTVELSRFPQEHSRLARIIERIKKSSD